MKLANVPFRAEQELARRWYCVTGQRPTSAPFLSGDGFRSLTPFRYEPETRQSFEPQALPNGALVFCDAWLLDEFLLTVAPKLRAPVTVIASNGDPNLTPDRATLIGDKVACLWTQNLAARHPRCRALPIGLENASLHANGVVRDFVKLRRQKEPHRNRILWGFAEVTNPAVRTRAREALERCPVAERLSPVNSRAYRKVLAQYRFVVSPEGNGLDCHRTWEALYLRVVPIVLRSVATEDFAALGLPLWIVDSYDEVLAVSEAELAARYREVAPGFSSPALWLNTWEARIRGQ